MIKITDIFFVCVSVYLQYILCYTTRLFGLGVVGAFNGIEKMMINKAINPCRYPTRHFFAINGSFIILD